MITVLLAACSPPDAVEVDNRPLPPTVPTPAPAPVPVPEPEPPTPLGELFPPAGPAAVDAPAPDFALESADGIFQLSQHAGNVILLDLSGFF